VARYPWRWNSSAAVPTIRARLSLRLTKTVVLLTGRRHKQPAQTGATIWLVGTTRYQSLVYDSCRWEGVALRPGDIVISTPPKCGTTWTQMICALLVFQQPELPAPLDRLSPWIDMTTRPRIEVWADLEAQQHRRFIKTHTPLDGLPIHPEVTYVVVGRDPRDVAISMDHHRRNMDFDAVARHRARAEEVDGVTGASPDATPPRRPLPTDERERFWRWVEDDRPITESGATLRYTLHHLASFWDARDDVDVVFLHYDELAADLEGEMRRLAEHLGIVVAEERWPELVDAAGLAAMRAKAESVAAVTDRELWPDPTTFFRQGTSQQWRALLDVDDVRRYAAIARSLAPSDLCDWVHRPPL